MKKAIRISFGAAVVCAAIAAGIMLYPMVMGALNLELIPVDHGGGVGWPLPTFFISLAAAGFFAVIGCLLLLLQILRNSKPR